MAHTHGYLHTSRGLRLVPHCVGPGLARYGDVFAVADVSTAVAEALRLPGGLGEVRASRWADLLKEAAQSEDDFFPGKVYALVMEVGATWPEDIATRCRVGDTWSSDHPDSEIAVTAVRSEYDELTRERIPALLMPSSESAEQMIEHWSMLSPSKVIEKEIRFVPDTEPMLLVDEFPHLKISKRAQVDGWSLTRCSELEEITRTPSGTRFEPIEMATQERSVLVLKPNDDLAALVVVDRALKLGLGPSGCKAVLDRREQQRNNERMRAAQAAKDTPSKVLALVGEEALKRGLPEGLLESEKAETGKAPDAHRVAQLAIHSHGHGVLRHHGKDIATNLPEAAGQFRGDSRSLQIVNQLGLPDSFAGARGVSLEPMLTVEGPTAFPRLHDYQERLAVNMFDLLTRYRAPKAMLCLPTGAGKTRVASEAIIRVIKERGLDGRPVLWIAQTEELCEQAVQSWKFVWSKVGPEEPLTISRLWNTNEAAAVKDSTHLVVATDAKLQVCLGKADYAWLRDAALVLIDEAHAAITPRYTEILDHLGITHRSAARPLIGLTATPYRGFNEEETRRLVARFGGVRLDKDVFVDDPYAELQELGVLARVEHRELTGATIKLTAHELQNIDFQGRLPASAEQRLADDHDRNDMLVEAVRDLPHDGPVLLFATSVNHARFMAAKLNGKGVRASAIDAATPIAERRKIIEDFRAGRIRVITNYGVLAQGFDAPATRTVIVARPTYSPNVYQQMIGRGLRGPRNGGKETCLILDVDDNITNYDKKLAFTQFEYLWSRA
jgi:superfamily II DNA or RNA helicase